jgi:hypothetical protein
MENGITAMPLHEKLELIVGIIVLIMLFLIYQRMGKIVK